jgi:hypothetical protein
MKKLLILSCIMYLVTTLGYADDGGWSTIADKTKYAKSEKERQFKLWKRRV